MYVKIHKPKTEYSKNRGSTSDLIEYLDKENNDLDGLEQEYFFNHDADNFSAGYVKADLDSHKGRLSKDETKFYMLTINPSYKELNHMDNDPEKFKDYVKDVMDEYAKGFGRNYEDGRPLKGSDLKYYVKIEQKRYYNYDDEKYKDTIKSNRAIDKEIVKIEDKFEAIKNPNKSEKKLFNKEKAYLENKYVRNKNGTIIKNGAERDGLQMHAHVVVHRYDKEKKIKLSPLANSKKSKNILNGKEENIGFNRSVFVENTEKIFDKKFEYDRKFEESYKYFKEAKLITKATNLLHLSNPKAYAKMVVKRALINMIANKELHKSLGYVTNPKKAPKKIANKVIKDIEKKAVVSVLKAMDLAAFSNPVTAAIQGIKKTAVAIKNSADKGMGI